MEIISFVNESDIIVVVVDTPYLMVGSKEIAEAANAIDTILTLLMHRWIMRPRRLNKYCLFRLNVKNGLRKAK